MSESVNDPLARQLQQLQPVAKGFDRDAVLFAAGQASAKSRRFWPKLAAILAATQAATLGLLCIRAFDAEVREVCIEQPPIVTRDVTTLRILPPTSSPYCRALAGADLSLLPRPEPVLDVVSSEPIWTVRSVASATTID